MELSDAKMRAYREEQLEWLLQDLADRRRDFRSDQQTRNHLINYTVILVGGFLAFLGSGGAGLLGRWDAFVYVGFALLTSFLGHLAVDLGIYAGLSTLYIKQDLLGRMRALGISDPTSYYGWERFLDSRRTSLGGTGYASTVIGCAGPFLLPTAAFFILGVMRMTLPVNRSWMEILGFALLALATLASLIVGARGIRDVARLARQSVEQPDGANRIGRRSEEMD